MKQFFFNINMHINIYILGDGGKKIKCKKRNKNQLDVTYFSDLECDLCSVTLWWKADHELCPHHLDVLDHTALYQKGPPSHK